MKVFSLLKDQKRMFFAQSTPFPEKLFTEKRESVLRLKVQRRNIVCGILSDRRSLQPFLEELTTSGLNPDHEFFILELLLEQLFLMWLTLLAQLESFMLLNIHNDQEEISLVLLRNERTSSQSLKTLVIHFDTE